MYREKGRWTQQEALSDQHGKSEDISQQHSFRLQNCCRLLRKHLHHGSRKRVSNKHLFEIIMMKRKVHITLHKHFCLLSVLFSSSAKDEPYWGLAVPPPPSALLLSYVPNPHFPFNFESKLPRLALKSGLKQILSL